MSCPHTLFKMKKLAHTHASRQHALNSPAFLHMLSQIIIDGTEPAAQPWNSLYNHDIYFQGSGEEQGPESVSRAAGSLARDCFCRVLCASPPRLPTLLLQNDL